MQVEELERAVQRLKKNSSGSSTNPGTDYGNDSCLKNAGSGQTHPLFNKSIEKGFFTSPGGSGGAPNQVPSRQASLTRSGEEERTNLQRQLAAMIVDPGQRNAGAVAVKSAGHARQEPRQSSMTSRQVSMMTNGFLKTSGHAREGSQGSLKENQPANKAQPVQEERRQLYEKQPT